MTLLPMTLSSMTSSSMTGRSTTSSRESRGAPGSGRSRTPMVATILALCAAFVMGQPAAVARADGGLGSVPSVGPTPEEVVSAVAASIQAATAITRALPRGPRSLADSISTSEARWDWPLLAPEIVISPFDGPTQRWLPGHRGVDLAGFEGASVRAVADGFVSFSGSINGVGVVSVIHRDGLLSTYQPVLNTPGKGTRVRRGDAIGALAPKGSHCWPLVCLHLGARRGKEYLDPMMFLRPWVVSLLPR